LKLAKLEIFQYDLPLVSPIQLTEIQTNTRSGFLIQMWDEQNNFGSGEIAPLPGLHSENLGLALENLQDLRSFLVDSEVPPDLDKLDGGFEKWFHGKMILPSVRFGLEMAILNLIADKNNQSLMSLLSENNQKSINLNGLVSGDKRQIVKQVVQLIRDGCQTIKLKVGRQAVDEDIQIANEVKKIIGQKARLRLDANRNWSLTEAVRFGKVLGSEHIEYIEEPLSEISNLDIFYEQTGLPIALDESLRQIPKRVLENIKGLIAFIIKPSLMDGFEKSMKFIRFGKAHNLYPVISSSFESGIGLTALANLASSLRPGDTAMGLDTFKWFKEDLLENGFNTTQGKLDLEFLNKRSKVVRQDLLKKIV
jgi:o-succinylbenzoate synthase